MVKVTRIAYSKDLNQGKYDQLEAIAQRLGQLRAEVWQRFGSINGVGVTDRQIRDGWLVEKREFDTPARLWKATLHDTFADITMYREAAKVKVRKAIHKRTDDEEERKRLYTLLKYDRWQEDSYLRRMMRKYYKHGKTKVDNQIILDPQCYKAFDHNGKGWIEVMSLTPRQRIAIPLNTNRLPVGTLRLLLRNGRAEIHYAVDSESECSTKPCGDDAIGVDKGYSEVLIDSDGDMHGSGLGELLSAESDYLKAKYQQRNKIEVARDEAITDAKPQKRETILINNLGRQKLDKRKQKHTANVRDKVFKAVHSIVDRATTIVSEELSAPIQSKKRYRKDTKRRLSGWVKGLISEALQSVSHRRGSTVVHVHCAYTSQNDLFFVKLRHKKQKNGFSSWCLVRTSSRGCVLLFRRGGFAGGRERCSEYSGKERRLRDTVVDSLSTG